MRVGPVLPQAENEHKLGDARSASAKEDAKLRQACQDFETVFVNQLLQSMRKTVMKGELFGNGREEEMFQEMMDWEVAKSIAGQESTGIGDLLYRQLRADIARQDSTSKERGESR